MASRRKGRRLAVQALYSWDAGNSDPTQTFSFLWEDKVFSGEVLDTELAFPRLIVQGVLEKQEEIDELIARHLDHWDITRVARVERAILRMATYCLRYVPDIPQQVTIDEAVELAKEFSGSDAFRFINGVLDAIARDQSVTQV